MINIFSTEEIHERDKAALWNKAVNNTFVELECQPIGNHRQFQGHVVNSDLGEGKVSVVTTTPHSVVRSQDCLRKSEKDFFLLSMQMNGESRIYQDAREVVLRPGDFTLYDTTRPYQLLFETAFKQSVFQIPRTMVLSHIPHAERITACALPRDKGLTRLARKYMASVSEELNIGSGVDNKHFLRAMMELLSVAYSDFVENKTPLASTTQYSQLVRVKEFILENLTDTNLNPDLIANVHNVSTRYLRKLFEHEDISLSRWILQKRLERTHQNFTDLRAKHLTISEIAYSCGFNDMAHFSKVFKKEYGLSPRHFRQQYFHKSH